jgi:hypothetical protein
LRIQLAQESPRYDANVGSQRASRQYDASAGKILLLLSLLSFPWWADMDAPSPEKEIARVVVEML